MLRHYRRRKPVGAQLVKLMILPSPPFTQDPLPESFEGEDFSPEIKQIAPRHQHRKFIALCSS